MAYSFMPASTGTNVLPVRSNWIEFFRTDFFRALIEYGKSNKTIRNAEFENVTPETIPNYAATGKKTVGVLSCRDGELPLISGSKDAIFQMMPDQNNGLPIPGITGVTKTHVEMKAAWLMRMQGIMKADLYLNRDPCIYETAPGIYGGCDVYIPRALPEGSVLTIHSPSGTKVYVGTGGQ
jgi:hypothetical protein